MSKDHFYHWDWLLKQKDRNGKRPIIYIVCSKVRGPGKTFDATKKLMERLLANGEKFILLCRIKDDLGTIAEGIFKHVLRQKYPEVTMYERKVGRIYSNIFIDVTKGKEKETLHAGYVIPLNSASSIKNISGMFADAEAFFFDEFQPMSKHEYLPDEVVKFQSIYESVARGNGQTCRYVPVYMSSNTIDRYNPYFVALGLVSKLQDNTRFYRGNGFVFQQTTNEYAVKAHKEQGISAILNTGRNSDYADDSTWANDCKTAVCKPDDWGRPTYFTTICYNGGEYGVKYYSDVGLYYIDRTPDKKHPFRFCLTLDGEKNLPLLKTSPIAKILRDAIEGGCVRYKDNGCRNMAMEMIV